MTLHCLEGKSTRLGKSKKDGNPGE